MKKLFILLLALLLISVPILVRILTQETSERYERETVLMDTRVRIVAYGDKNTPDYINKALQKMRELENILSIYNEHSEAYQLNKNGYIEGSFPAFALFNKRFFVFSQFD
jgi:Membrane-associated lipoprotein involved in thiamine biosynthesis